MALTEEKRNEIISGTGTRTENTLMVYDYINQMYQSNGCRPVVVRQMDMLPKDMSMNQLKAHRATALLEKHGFIKRTKTFPNDVILTDKDTGERHIFNSSAEASRFMGKEDSYINGFLQRGYDDGEPDENGFVSLRDFERRGDTPDYKIEVKKARQRGETYEYEILK